MEHFDPRVLLTGDYTYELPDERIARYPLEQRDGSKLLQYRSGSVSDAGFTDLPGLLDDGDLMIFNQTKVIHARLLFAKPTGSVIEIFCLEPYDDPDPATALQKRGTCVWKVLIGNAKRWKEPVLRMRHEKAGELVLFAEQVGRAGDTPLVRFTWNGIQTFAEIIEMFGRLPIPPYLNREVESSDEIRYQTVYADKEGSVAAPTAGLHFTDHVFRTLAERGIERSFITLHVGAGTFRPLKADTLGSHDMHEERIMVDRQDIARLLHQIRSKKRIIVVGTTSMRTLESLYWLGVSVISGDKPFFVDQWEAYSREERNVGTDEALEALEGYLEEHDLDQLQATTRILIAPGYRFRIADALITNFHQPSSTLLLLIAAFVGEDWRKIYRHALDNDYRFLSYGDSSLLFRNSQ